MVEGVRVWTTDEGLTMKSYSGTELMLTPDGRIYHLHLYPEQLCSTVLLVGDPGRIPAIASHLKAPQELAYNREFRSVSGTYRGMPVLALSHGIGAGCVDIVVNELDALANIDFSSRADNPVHRQLRLVRLGTSGVLRRDIPLDRPLITAVSIGLDSVPYFYARWQVEPGGGVAAAFADFVRWPQELPRPYSVGASAHLLDTFAAMGEQVLTLSCPGFYAPQGRCLRYGLAGGSWLERLPSFSSNGLKLVNMEMESAPLMLLSTLLGHECITITVPVDNRASGALPLNAKAAMDAAIELVLAQLADSAGTSPIRREEA